MYFIEDFIEIVLMLAGALIATVFIGLAVITVFNLEIFGINATKDPVLTKIESCEARAEEILGGSPQFERGTEDVKDDKYTITGKVTTTFDNAENEKTYTCTVEVVDGESVAKIDSIA